MSIYYKRRRKREENPDEEKNIRQQQYNFQTLYDENLMTFFSLALFYMYVPLVVG